MAGEPPDAQVPCGGQSIASRIRRCHARGSLAEHGPVQQISWLRLMPPTELLAEYYFRMDGEGGNAVDWGVLLFQALGGGMLHFFWTLEFEAVQKGEMLPVF